MPLSPPINPGINATIIRPGEQLFAIGSHAKRANFASQQRRAFNFLLGINSYFNRNGLGNPEEKKIAIVGAGLCGFTLATLMHCLRWKVEIFDKNIPTDQWELKNASEVSHRYINPLYVDWPQTNEMLSHYPDTTNFPFLNWHSGTAESIRSTIVEQSQKLIDFYQTNKETKKTKPLKYTSDSHLQKIEKNVTNTGTKYTLHFKKGKQKSGYDICILCTGFGLEKSINGINSTKYWDKAGHQNFRESTCKSKFVVGQ